MHCGNPILTSVYRKPIHTDRYLDFTSHDPPVHKAAVVNTLLSRADALSSSSTLLQQEHSMIALLTIILELLLAHIHILDT